MGCPGDDSGTDTGAGDSTTTGAGSTTGGNVGDTSTTGNDETGGATTSGSSGAATTEGDSTSAGSSGGDTTDGDESSSSSGEDMPSACEVYAQIAVDCLGEDPSYQAKIATYCESYIMMLEVEVHPTCGSLWEDAIACLSTLTCKEAQMVGDKGGPCAMEFDSFDTLCGDGAGKPEPPKP